MSNEIETINDFILAQGRANDVGLSLSVSDDELMIVSDYSPTKLCSLEAVHNFLSGYELMHKKYKEETLIKPSERPRED